MLRPSTFLALDAAIADVLAVFASLQVLALDEADVAGFRGKRLGDHVGERMAGEDLGSAFDGEFLEVEWKGCNRNWPRTVELISIPA